MIEQGNQVLKTLGYTEHSKKHALKVAEYAAEILKITGADAHQIDWHKLQVTCTILEIVSIDRIMRTVELF